MTGSPRRIYAIGDIHGYDVALIRVLEAIENDGYQRELDLVVFLGDYIDRGPESARVVAKVKAMQESGAAIALRGNHEQMMVDAYRSGPNSLDWPMWWYQGGRETALSYSKSTQRVPDEIVGWASLLPISFESPISNHLFVHAGIRPEVPLPHQDEEDLLWIRDEFLDWEGEHPYVIVHGHTPVIEPTVRKNRIGIDTVLMSGFVSALRIDPDADPKIIRFHVNYAKFVEHGEVVK